MERKLLLIALFVLLIIAGCQREYSLENGLVASGSLRAVSGDCLPKKVAGVYKESTPLSVDNTVDVTVDVTAPGR